jgi:hypothetical protein
MLAFAAFAVLLRERDGPPRAGLTFAGGLLVGLGISVEYPRGARGSRAPCVRADPSRAALRRGLAFVAGRRRSSSALAFNHVGVRLAVPLPVRGLDGRARRQAAARIFGLTLRTSTRCWRSSSHRPGSRLSHAASSARSSCTSGEAGGGVAAARTSGRVPALTTRRSSSRSRRVPGTALPRPGAPVPRRWLRRRFAASRGRRSASRSPRARSLAAAIYHVPLAAWDSQVIHRLRTGGYVRSVLDLADRRRSRRTCPSFSRSRSPRRCLPRDPALSAPGRPSPRSPSHSAAGR